jgi:hypothetical protein
VLAGCGGQAPDVQLLDTPGARLDADATRPLPLVFFGTRKILDDKVPVP